MIDLFALGLTHALMALAAWRLMARADLDLGDGGGKRRPPREIEARPRDD
jgi:hypothetical protein